jgi:hypothetical protein
MAADSKASTAEWILLRDAKALVVEAYGAPQLAEQLLVRWLAAGNVRWWSKLLEGYVWKDVPEPQPGDPHFWSNSQHIHINWEESWARCRGFYSYGFYQITVPRADVLAVLPAAQYGTAPNKTGRQIDRVNRALQELYPREHYPNGVPRQIPTETVRGKVAYFLDDETKALNLANPSWKVVARALGRTK